MENQAPFQNIEVRKEFGPKVPELFMDGDQIQQVFMNILLNAADAMAAGGAFTISSSYAPGDSFVQVKFSDTGSGIAAEEIPHIFEPFYTTKQDGKGVCLGLSVVYGIIERHGGTIDIRSESGRAPSS